MIFYFSFLFYLLSPNLDSKKIFSEAGLKLFLKTCQNCFESTYDEVLF